MAERATLRMQTSDPGTQEWSGPKGRTATVINKIHAAKNLEELFFEIKNDLANLFNVEQLTLYAVDSQKKEIYAKYLLAQQRRPAKFDYLLEQQLLTPHELSTAIAEARRKACDVETVLLETYRVPKAELGQVLSRFYGCPFVEYDDRTVLDRTLLKDLNFEFLKASYAMPLRRDGATIEVLIDNPHDLVKTEHLQILLRGAPLRWLVGLRKDILHYLADATSRLPELGSIQDILE